MLPPTLPLPTYGFLCPWLLFSSYCGWAIYSSAKTNSSTCENPVGANVTIYLESDYFSPPPLLPSRSKPPSWFISRLPPFSSWFLPYHSELILNAADNTMLSKFNYSVAFLHQKASRGLPCHHKTPNLYYACMMYDDLTLHHLSEVIPHDFPPHLLQFSSSGLQAISGTHLAAWCLRVSTPALCPHVQMAYTFTSRSLLKTHIFKMSFLHHVGVLDPQNLNIFYFNT